MLYVIIICVYGPESWLYNQIYEIWNFNMPKGYSCICFYSVSIGFPVLKYLDDFADAEKGNNAK